MRHLVIASIIALCAAACGNLSPAEPSDIEREPVLVVEPARPIRFNATILYMLSYRFTNPKAAIENVTITRVEFTILGADGSAYGTGEDGALTFGQTATLPPGQFRTGVGSVFDANTTRPTATTYIVRLFFTRANGSTWRIEERSTVRPLV